MGDVRVRRGAFSNTFSPNVYKEVTSSATYCCYDRIHKE